MNKFSSFKEEQLLFENWRGYVSEELDEQAQMTPDDKAEEMLKILSSMRQDDTDAFNKALNALGKVSTEVGV
jgi:hypothetical protein